MKNSTPIQVRAGDLKPSLVGLGKIADPKAKHPALQCIRVKPLDTRVLQLSASNLDFHFDLTVKVESGAKYEPFLLPLAALREQVRGCKANDIVQLRPQSGSPPVSEFPEPTKFRSARVELTREMSRSLLQAFDCASSDPSRHVLQGVFLDVSDTGKNAHRMVATDGRQLYSSNSMHLPSLKSSVIIPHHPLWQWKGITSSVTADPWALRVASGKEGNQPFRIETKHWQLTGKTIIGNYPSYRQVIPPRSKFKTHVELPTEVAKAIADSIPKLPGKKQHNKPVGLHLEKDLVSLLAHEKSDDPWQFYPIGHVKVEGPDQTIFVNRDYLRRAASFGLSEISLIDPQSPIQFSRKGDLMIVMPVRGENTDHLERPSSLKPMVLTARAKNSVAKKQPTVASTKSDPMDEVEARIAEANDAIAVAGEKLSSAKVSLGNARNQRTEDQAKLKGFRSLFRSIQKLTTSSN